MPSGATQQTLFEQSLKVFPNPVVDNVTFKNYYAPIQTVVIYDMRGNELQRLHSNDISATLNLSELGKGIYLYKVTAPGNILFYGKLVK
ncbi:MAG: T9SS type A sorting domain-containing protein [Bacteroidetes bacterium]|nr:T9SS type A sorting domain-containing protein [Bacteroidota bacterium]